MPDLLPPKVIGELSTLNTYVIVENQQAGATLRIWANDTTEIATKAGAAGGRDQLFIDPAFLPLAVGTAITATQEDAGGSSKPSPVPVVVQRVPSPPSKAQFIGAIYTCVSFVRVIGLTPGATFEVHQPGRRRYRTGIATGQGRDIQRLSRGPP